MSISTLKRLTTIKHIRTAVTGLCVGLFCSALCLFAPRANAYTDDELEDVPPLVKLIVQSTYATHYSDKSADDIYFIYGLYDANSSLATSYAVAVYYIPDITLNEGLLFDRGSFTEDYLGQAVSSDSDFANVTFRFVYPSTSNQFPAGYSTENGYQGNRVSTFRTYLDGWGNMNPIELYGDVPSNYIDWSGTGFDVQYNEIAETIGTISEKNGTPLLLDYVTEQGFTFGDKAYLVADYGSHTNLEIPISATVPTNYEGLYLRPYHYNQYLQGFNMAITPGLNPNDFSYWWDWKLVIPYQYKTVNNITAYVLTDKSNPTGNLYEDIALSIPLTDSTLSTGKYIVGTSSLWGNKITADYGVQTRIGFVVCSSWWQQGRGVNDVIVGFSYQLIDDNTGDIVEGNNSDNYNTYVNNYNKTVLTGLSGVDYGRKTFSADWSGANLTTDDIDYNDNFRFDDTQVTSLFTRIFTAGNGFLTTAVLGVLSIAFAAYILFGKH